MFPTVAHFPPLHDTNTFLGPSHEWLWKGSGESGRYAHLGQIPVATSTFRDLTMREEPRYFLLRESHMRSTNTMDTTRLGHALFALIGTVTFSIVMLLPTIVMP